MNGPNLLTLLRIFFVPLLVAALLGGGFVEPYLAALTGPLAITRETFALLIFLAAAATDLLDGYLARRWGQITTVGTLLDPIADKLLISAALVSLVDMHRVPAWMVILIIGREFAVSGLRSIAAAGGYTIEASDLGKTKMVAQVVAIALVIAGIRWPQLDQLALIAMWAVVLVRAGIRRRLFPQVLGQRGQPREIPPAPRIAGLAAPAAQAEARRRGCLGESGEQRLGDHRQTRSLPRIQPADQVRDVFKSRALNQAARNRAAVAALAVHHDRFRGVQIAQHFGDAVEGLVQRARDVALVPFRSCGEHRRSGSNRAPRRVPASIPPP